VSHASIHDAPVIAEILLATDEASMRIRYVLVAVLCLLYLPVSSWAQWREMNPVVNAQQQADGALLTMKTGVLRLQVCTDSMIRVTFAPALPLHQRKDYVIVKTTWPAAKFSYAATDKEIVLTTAKLKISIERADGAITYSDASGQWREDVSRRVNGERLWLA
jgi:Domain of unknown function (DUF4968)